MTTSSTPTVQRAAVDGATDADLSLAPDLLAALRPVASDLVDVITDEVQRVVEDYGPTAGSIYAANTRLTIARAVDYFLDRAGDPTTPRSELDETLRQLGRGEAYEGRTLDPLVTALHLGAQVSGQHLIAAYADLGRTRREADLVVAQIALFIESMIPAAAAGYREANEQLSDAAHEWRRRVLDLILAGADPGELTDYAGVGNWALPVAVVLAAVRPNPTAALPSARMLRPTALADLHSAEPVVLLPAPVSAATRAELGVLFVDHQVALGCPVALRDAAASLRWARRALALADAGVLPANPVIDCADHIGALWIHSEPLLVDIVDRTLLAPLYAEPPHSRRILGETLLAWIETRGASAPTLARVLGKHPQTVRYRLRRLRVMFGSLLDQPERVTEMHYALRAGATRWNDGPTGPSVRG